MTVPARLVSAAKVLGCVFFAGHMAATCTQQIPAQSALRPLAEPFYRYEELTGIWQSWNMFTTPPYLHTYGVDIEVAEADGTRSTAGVMLPGLKPYDHTLRAESFLTCVLDDETCTLYLAGYAGRVCQELQAQRGPGRRTIVFHEAYERLRFLPDIRKNGVIGNPEEHRSKPFECGG